MGQLQKAKGDVGQMDFTEKATQADSSVMFSPASARGGLALAREKVNRGSGLAAGEEEASPEEQKEYERALEVLHTVMYTNEGTSEAIAGMIQPEDKIGSVAKAGIMIVQQLDQKIDMDESIIAEITVDTADRLIEMAERAKGMQFSEKETQAVAGATWEGVMEIFGIDEDTYEEMTQGMGDEELDKAEQEYKGFLGD